MPQFTISQLNAGDSDYVIKDTDVMMVTVGTQSTDLSSVQVSFKQFAEWIIQTYTANHGLHVTGNVAVSGLSAVGGTIAPIRFASLPNDNADKAEINALKAGDLYVALSGDHNGYVCVKK